MKNNDERYMREALKEAKKAYQKQEIPVGAIIVYQDKVGVVSGQTYYVATKESQHKGIDCVSDTSYEPTLDTTPYDIDYWPYQSIYEDNDLFLDQLADIYFN